MIFEAAPLTSDWNAGFGVAATIDFAGPAVTVEPVPVLPLVVLPVELALFHLRVGEYFHAAK